VNHSAPRQATNGWNATSMWSPTASGGPTSGPADAGLTSYGWVTVPA
jgi:hypothetical protein